MHAKRIPNALIVGKVLGKTYYFAKSKQQFCRIHNKGFYVKVGFKKIISRKMWRNLNKEIRLEVDGRPISIPSHVEGIIVLNIMR